MILCLLGSARAGTASLVTDIRVGHSSERVRVVFDLERHAVYEQQKTANPNRATIVIKDVVLGEEAQQAVVQGGIPQPMDIYSWKGDRVRIDLDLDVMGSFRILTLNNPYRLVVDLYGVSKEPVSPPGAVRQLTDKERRAEREIRTIVIDPGHGGKDTGAMVDRDKDHKALKEKDLVLDISLRLRRIMEQRHDAIIHMTRETDVFVPLDDRVAFAKEKQADLFVSIHANAHRSSTIGGLEVYRFGKAEDQQALEVAARENSTSLGEAREISDSTLLLLAEKRLEKWIEESQNLAWEMSTAMSEHLEPDYNLTDRGVKTAPFYVLRHITMPGILVEVAYLTHASDRQHLVSPAFRQQVAESIFTGISEYIKYIKSRRIASG